MRLVDFDTARVLFLVGYDGYYRFFHAFIRDDVHKTVPLEEGQKYKEENENGIVRLWPAPSLDNVADWLRKTYSVQIVLDFQCPIGDKAKNLKDYGWGYKIHFYGKGLHVYGDKFYPAHDDAFADAIKRTLERISNIKYFS